MGFISDIYSIKHTTPLLTDKYHITTAYAYWLEGRHNIKAVFYVCARDFPNNYNYMIAAGLEGIIDIINRWQKHGFSKSDIKFLQKQNFPDNFLKYLESLRFNLKIDAAPEGTIFFPHEPILRIEGSIVEAKILESVALCILNGHSSYATHAVRQYYAINTKMKNHSPQGKISIQGLRRGPTIGAALEASRTLALFGYSNTSTGIAAKMFNQEFTGTMDHAWIMTHGAEIGNVSLNEMLKLQMSENKNDNNKLHKAMAKDAFRSFALTYNQNGILLVDTHNPIIGIENAITVIKELRELGLGENYGIRFDSGDITTLSKIALRRFAEEGFIKDLNIKKNNTKYKNNAKYNTKYDIKNISDAELLKYADKCTVFCVASDNINEDNAYKMRENGAFLKLWGIGTAGSYPKQLNLVYKISGIYNIDEVGNVTFQNTMKISNGAKHKSSNPGIINSRRFYDKDDNLIYIIIYDENLGINPKLITKLKLNKLKQSKNIKLKNKNILVPVFDNNGKFIYKYDIPKNNASKDATLTKDIIQNTTNAQLNSIQKFNPIKNIFLDYNLVKIKNNFIKSNLKSKPST